MFTFSRHKTAITKPTLCWHRDCTKSSQVAMHGPRFISHRSTPVSAKTFDCVNRNRGEDPTAEVVPVVSAHSWWCLPAKVTRCFHGCGGHLAVQSSHCVLEGIQRSAWHVVCVLCVEAGCVNLADSRYTQSLPNRAPYPHSTLTGTSTLNTHHSTTTPFLYRR